MIRNASASKWIRRICIVALSIAMFLGLTTGVSAVRPGKMSYSAEMSAAQRAVAAMHPDEKIRNSDYLAEKFVSDNYWHYRHYSKDFDRSMQFVKVFRIGGYYYVNARTKHFDKLLQEAGKNRLQQVVLLGAGFDSRPYRFGRALPGVRFFEMDHAPTSMYKKERIKAIFGKIPDNVTFVPIDFNAWNIIDALEKAGYDPKQITCFIWEGTSMYVTKEAIDRTLRFIATQSAPGSTVVLDYIPELAIQGDSEQYAGLRRVAFRMELAGEPFRGGLPDRVQAVETYINSCGLEVLSNIGHEGLTWMYLIGSDGKPDGQPSPYYRIVHARVPEPGTTLATSGKATEGADSDNPAKND